MEPLTRVEYEERWSRSDQRSAQVCFIVPDYVTENHDVMEASSVMVLHEVKNEYRFPHPVWSQMIADWISVGRILVERADEPTIFDIELGIHGNVL